jgi:hypothetical protein
MNTTLKTILIAAALLLVAAVLVMSGFLISRNRIPAWDGFGGFRGSRQAGSEVTAWNTRAFGRGWTSGRMGGMMGGRMMGGFGNQFAGQNFRRGGGMMGWNTANPSTNAQPLSLAAARSAVEDYLITLGNDDLVLAEVMVFDRNAYAVVVEKSTGMGAMELLVDPSTLAVFPEYGPQHMWNAKYGMMGGRAFSFSGARACGMGFNFNAAISPAAQTALTMDEAAQSASQYLDENFQNAELDPLGQPFYGYFTFDYSVDGQTAGMVSVNSTNGQVWPHTWHGQFIEEWEAGDSE